MNNKLTTAVLTTHAPIKDAIQQELLLKISNVPETEKNTKTYTCIRPVIMD